VAEEDVPGTTGDAAEGDGQEAVWRDLVARFDAPAPADGEVPWPELEDLDGPVHVTPAPPPAMPPPVMPPAVPEALPREPPTNPPGLTGGAGVPAAPALPEAPWPPAPPVGASAGRGPRDGTVPDDPADEHYVPPPPLPLPKLDPITKGAWLALFGGPLYLLIATAVGGSVSGLAVFLSVAAFVGGFAILVLRMDNGGGPRDSGPDDGAVV
jgi:hypothetical protein